MSQASQVPEVLGRRRDLHVVADRDIDVAAAETAAAQMLQALGLDLDDETLAGTPARMVRSFVELLTPREFTLTTFPNSEGYEDLIVARRIPFTSLCEHHMLAFTGCATVGYLPDARILGLSKLARVVELFARRPQVQERLTMQIARWLDTELQPKGVGVVLEAEHTCMTLRGVGARGATTVTSAVFGTLRDDPRGREQLLALARDT